MASIARKSSSGVSDERIVTEQRRVSDLLGIDLSSEEDIESLLRQVLFINPLIILVQEFWSSTLHQSLYEINMYARYFT